MQMGFRIRGDSIFYISAWRLLLALVLDLVSQLVLDKCSSCQISNGTFAGTAHPGNSKLITHAWMLLRSLLEKEDFLQAAEMVRGSTACIQCFYAYQRAFMLTILSRNTSAILFFPHLSKLKSDQRIHLWDFYQDDVKSPSFSLRDLKVLHPYPLCRLSELT